MAYAHHRERGGHGRGEERGRTSGTGRRPATRRRPPARRSLSARRALRREVASTVAVLVEPEDFLTMRGYASFFPFRDYASYLRQLEHLLRSLATQERHLRVALFDPAEYVQFCTEQRLSPDAVAARARYTADVAALTATIPYRGQSIDSLRVQLRDASQRQRTLERAVEVLAAAGVCACCGKDRGHIAWGHASRALAHILAAGGPGGHHLVCSVIVGDSALIATLCADRGVTDTVQLHEYNALVACTVLAAALAADAPGGIVMRTTDQEGDAPDVLRGWRVQRGWLRALTAAEVFDAYCTDSRTGEPIPPETGVEYRAGSDLERPEDGH